MRSSVVFLAIFFLLTCRSARSARDEEEGENSSSANDEDRLLQLHRRTNAHGGKQRELSLLNPLLQEIAGGKMFVRESDLTKEMLLLFILTKVPNAMHTVRWSDAPPENTQKANNDNHRFQPPVGGESRDDRAPTPGHGQMRFKVGDRVLVPMGQKGFSAGEVTEIGLKGQDNCEQCPGGVAAYVVQLDGAQAVLVPLDEDGWIQEQPPQWKEQQEMARRRLEEMDRLASGDVATEGGGEEGEEEEDDDDEVAAFKAQERARKQANELHVTGFNLPENDPRRLRFLEKSLKLDPQQLNVYTNHGFTLAKLDRQEEAAVIWRTGLDIGKAIRDEGRDREFENFDSNMKALQNNLRMAYTNLGKKKEAFKLHREFADTGGRSAASVPITNDAVTKGGATSGGGGGGMNIGAEDDDENEDADDDDGKLSFDLTDVLRFDVGDEVLVPMGNDGFSPGVVKEAGVDEQHQCEQCPNGRAAYIVQLDDGGPVLVPLDEDGWIKNRWSSGEDAMSEDDDEITDEEDEL